jgi:hypothetical protein
MNKLKYVISVFACYDAPFALSLTQEYYSLLICLGDRQ